MPIKRGSWPRNIIPALIFLVFLFTLNFSLGAHIVRTFAGQTITNISFNEDVGGIFNITINNTDGITGNAFQNITQVNITLPSNFTFIGDSNRTTATVNVSFTNTSTVLSWTNTSAFVINATNGSALIFFSFNATVPNPANYTLVIRTLNGSGTFESNISVQINDTTKPSDIIYNTSTESQGSNVSRNYILVNVTAIDNGRFANITIYLFNRTNGLINSSNSTTSPLFVNFSGLSDGSYYFNATAIDEFGNINVTTAQNVTIDRGAPLASDSNFSTPSPGQNRSGLLVLNISVADLNTSIGAVMFNITNGSGVQNATYFASNSAGTQWNITINTAHFPDGLYNITAYVNDTAGNQNSTAVVYSIRFDNTAPTVSSFSCTPNPVNKDATITCSCSGSDGSGTGVNTTSYTVNPSTALTGTFDTTCGITDNVNLGSSTSTFSYTVSGGGSGSGGGSSGGGSSGGSTDGSDDGGEEPDLAPEVWTQTYSEESSDLSERGSVSAELGQTERVAIQVGGEIHYVGIISITETTATIEISSTPQEVTLSIGQNKKVDLTDDGYYDTEVTLVSITDGKAQIMINSIYEQVVTPEDSTTGTETSRSLTWLWIVIVLAVIIVVIIVVIKQKKKKY